MFCSPSTEIHQTCPSNFLFHQGITNPTQTWIEYDASVTFLKIPLQDSQWLLQFLHKPVNAFFHMFHISELTFEGTYQRQLNYHDPATGSQSLETNIAQLRVKNYDLLTISYHNECTSCIIYGNILYVMLVLKYLEIFTTQVTMETVTKRTESVLRSLFFICVFKSKIFFIS